MTDNKLSNVLQWASFIAIVPFAAQVFGFIEMPKILFFTTIALLSTTIFWGLMGKTGLNVDAVKNEEKSENLADSVGYKNI